MKPFLIIVTSLILSVLYVGCGNNTSNLIALGGLVPGYRGPGEVWNVFVNTNANLIELTHQTNIAMGIDYEGISAFTTYNTGFTQMTVNSAGPDLNGPGLGAVTSAVYIPGYVFFLSPYSAADTMAMIPPVCPTGDMSLNWIKLRQPSSWAKGSSGGNSFGTVSFPLATGVASLVNTFNLDTSGSGMTSDLGASTLSTSVGCGTGQYFDGNTQIFTSTNGIIVNPIASNEVYFGVAAASAPALTDIQGDYAGYLYQAGGPTNDPVSITLSSTGTGTLDILSDVTNGTSAGGSNPTIAIGSVALSGTGTSGFLGGSITFSGSNPLVCLAQHAAGGSAQNMIVCNGLNDSNKFVSLVLTSH